MYPKATIRRRHPVGLCSETSRCSGAICATWSSASRASCSTSAVTCRCGRATSSDAPGVSGMGPPSRAIEDRDVAAPGTRAWV